MENGAMVAAKAMGTIYLDLRDRKLVLNSIVRKFHVKCFDDDKIGFYVRPQKYNARSYIGGANLEMRSNGQVACEVITKMEFTVSKVNEKYPMRIASSPVSLTYSMTLTRSGYVSEGLILIRYHNLEVRNDIFISYSVGLRCGATVLARDGTIEPLEKIEDSPGSKLNTRKASASLAPANSASYSASLFEASNLNIMAYSNLSPWGLSTIMPAPLPMLVEDPSTNNVHVGREQPASFSNISATKSANTCALMAGLLRCSASRLLLTSISSIPERHDVKVKGRDNISKEISSSKRDALCLKTFLNGASLASAGIRWWQFTRDLICPYGEDGISVVDNEPPPAPLRGITLLCLMGCQPFLGLANPSTAGFDPWWAPRPDSGMLCLKIMWLIPKNSVFGSIKNYKKNVVFVYHGQHTSCQTEIVLLSHNLLCTINSSFYIGIKKWVTVAESHNSTTRISLTPITVGQEVTVRLVEANMETGRISLTMRESDNKKTSKFNRGQDLEGKVKNLTRAGAFISLPEGEEGFLPQSEEADEGFANVMGGSSLEVGQEVSVRVLRITRGQVTLTMKKEEDAGKLDEKLSQGVVHTATNPFVLAFRSNKDISAFLDEQVEKAEEVVEDTLSETLDTSRTNDVEIESIEEVEASAVLLDHDGSPSAEDESAEEIPPIEAQENKKEAESSGEVADVSSEIAEEVKDSAVENVTVTDDEQSQPDASVDVVEEVTENIADDAITKDEDQSEKTDSIESSSARVESLDLETTSAESPVIGEVSEKLGEDIIMNEVETQTSVDSQQNGNVSTLSEQSSVASPAETTAKAAISPALVKQLRDETGAGMMDCKKALSETGGDIIQAQEFLRKKGLASADKKASRATAEGRIGSYIHDTRIGVLIEVNCETDFVARGDIFKELVEDLAMQVAACPQVQYLDTEDVPKEIVDKEKEIEMQKEDLLVKPEQIRSKIVDGRIRKRLEEVALLEQPFIKDDKIVVKDWVKQTISTIGENIKVKRFVRYNLGEGLEKKSQDFAAEVAAQTAAKPVPTPVNQEPAAAEIKETVEIPPKATVSAALVKELREETGAGMMDCKKALSETGGDLEKAQEYLRKKGLSTADKKSSRLAAEGRIGSYIHDSRIGVLIEVNCETDFVGRSQNFKELVDDLAMQVVASPQVQYVSIEDIPESIVNKEKQLEMQREDLQSKPENIREKIVEGRVTKRLGELALLEQPFIKNDSLLVKDLVKQTVAALGENVKVRRFERFTLGEENDANLETEA
ncbi:hypothetical protein BUALT_Bualt09G0023200 [Buddleja alternifolia]|uniref:Elongation factor Ts, mitochondrial n=1 Tax=Buddleja alternifolia TaxID=168488 RepID=A0AAV6WZC1_9LAMI|nr:hypothetical protein BUALT_Bualt09G0023200 [Buddleja alternifolia]